MDLANSVGLGWVVNGLYCADGSVQSRFGIGEQANACRECGVPTTCYLGFVDGKIPASGATGITLQ
jgi:hypothetical protein